MPKKQQADLTALMSPGEAAATLGVTTRTLARMGERGELTVVLLPSGHRRFLRADIESLRGGDEPALAEGSDAS